MRDLIVITIIFVLVFGGDFFIKDYIESSSKDLIQHIEELSGDFDASYEIRIEKVEKLKKSWEEKECPWIIIEYHDEINDIEDLVIETYSYYLNNNKEDFEISYRKLVRIIEDLKNRVDLSLENVL